MAKLTKEKALLIGKEYLENKQINISSTDSININYKSNEHIKSGIFKDIWVLGYEVKFFSEEKSIFLLIDDEDGSILYGVHDTGYF